MWSVKLPAKKIRSSKGKDRANLGMISLAARVSRHLLGCSQGLVESWKSRETLLLLSSTPLTKMEGGIKSEFEKSGFTLDDEEDILQICLTFCIQYKLSAADIVANWDLYSINRGLDSTVQSSHMGAFLEQLQNEQIDEIKVRDKASGLHLYSTDVAMIFNGTYRAPEAILDTPPDKHTLAREKSFDSAQRTNSIKRSSEKPLESVAPFGTRRNKFVVQLTLNEHPNTQTIKTEEVDAESEDKIIKRVQPSKKCSLVINRSQLEPGCRYMYDRIEDKFNFLENCIKKRATAYVSSGRYDEPVDPSVASQKSIFAVGMICCEEEGRLKEKPILLQSSVEHSGGQRVRLDLQKLNQFSIFPGQVVGIEGHNPSRHCLIASNIIDHVPLSTTTNEEHPSKRQALDYDFQLSEVSLETPELSLIVAAGPFTTSDNLLFEPLNDLLSYARRKQPQLLVLLGPFIDSDHPELKKGAINQSFDEMFRIEILGKLQDYVEYMGSTVQVILMPSVRDANHDFVFPQPAFEIHPADFSDQINSVSNPGVFCANQVKVACCTVDILKHLSAEEICRNPQGGSKQRLTNLAKHVLNQQSFYPLYPTSEDVPFDFSLATKALHFSSIPDILVLPSDLAHFVKVLDLGDANDGEERPKCICENPGRLARGEGGGFFVEINYGGNPDSSNASVIRI